MVHFRQLLLLFLVPLGVAPLAEAASFLAPRAYLPGGGTGAVADFNGDGKPDVAAGNNNTTVSILLGSGNGTLQEPVNYVVSTVSGDIVWNIVAVDLNGDGKIDLAVLVANTINNSEVSANLVVLLGNGDGTFQPPITTGYSSSGGPSTSLTAADFNGDGKLDLVLNEPRGFTILLGNGDGSFGPPITHSSKGDDGDLAVGDFNGDGKPDIALIEYGFGTNPTGIVTIWLNSGNATFEAVYDQGLHPDVNSLVVADFNGDGILDLAFTSDGPPALGILLGNGNGTFQPAVYDYAGENSLSGIVVGDFNGDGKPDLALDVDGGYATEILLNQGNGTFKVANGYYFSGVVAVADMNGDGKADLVLGPSVVILLGEGNGRFQYVPAISLGYNQNQSSFNSISVGDFNGDGKPDLAVSDSLYGAVLILLGNGNGTFQTAAGYNLGATTPDSMAIGDFNGDGRPDLLVAASQGSESELYVLLGNGDGTFQLPVTIAEGAYAFSVLAADFNHDGKLDLAVTEPYDGGGSVSIMLGNGNGTFQPPVSYTAGNYPEWIATGDFNGDGKLDLAVANFNSNDVSILFGNGDGTFGPVINYNVGTRPTAIAVGDFTGHGKRDLVVANSGTYSRFFADSSVSILICNGDGTFQPAVNYSVGEDPLAVAVADFSGYGTDDVAIISTYSNAVVTLGGNGNGTFRPAKAFAAGSSPNSLAVGDFNRDGRPDLMVSDSANILFELFNDTLH